MLLYFNRIGYSIKRSLIFSLLIIGASIRPHASFGQFFTNEILKNMFRNGQLNGSFKKEFSSTINMDQIQMQELDSILGISIKNTLKVPVKKPVISIDFLPLTIRQQYNTQLPYEWNNAPMIPAKGYQEVISAGFYAKIGKHFTVQFAPEIMYAENKNFEQFSQQLGDRSWMSYYRFLNTSDIPSQMGTGSYNKFFPGQSSVRYNFKSFSVGISSENMWWGPGWRNALIISNNAPGFVHFTFNTTKPVHTGIGTFEGQIIAGKLEESDILPPRIFSIDTVGNFLYQPKLKQWRYITGMILTWQPKWMKNLFLGFAKSSYLYHSDISNPLDVLPLQGFFGRSITATEANGKKSSMGSLFARYVMPGDKAELYMEFGNKNYSLMPWNVIQVESYRRAYVAGFRKLFPARKGAYIQLTTELTQMQAPVAELIRNPDSWYTDPYVRQGYTNLGRVIGAGIGPGSNSQTLEISWIKGIKKIGLQFERVRYNSDFYYYAFEYLQDFRRHWIDISTTLKVDWNYKHLFASTQLGIIRSYNYKWLIIQVNPNDFFAPGNEYLNISGRLSVSYRF